MKRILHDNGEGGLAIVIPAPNYLAALKERNPDATETQLMEFIANKDVPNGIAFEVVDEVDIPSDRTFRNAWEHDTTEAFEKVKTNITKAKLIAHDVRRAARAEAFAPLDVQATIPLFAEAAETARQVIRDNDALKQNAIDIAIDEVTLKAAMETPVV